jgi:hypothetical protein
MNVLEKAACIEVRRRRPWLSHEIDRQRVRSTVSKARDADVKLARAITPSSQQEAVLGGRHVGKGD